MRSFRPFRAPAFRRTLPAVLLTVLAVSAGAAFAGALPLAVTPAQADLGDVPAGSVGVLEFKVENSGDKAARVTYIFAECDCSFDLPAGGSIPAGGTFDFEAHYHLDEAEPGRWEEMITLLTDHPEQGEIRIPITAHVLPNGSGADTYPTGG